MLEIDMVEAGTVTMGGRLDAAAADQAESYLDDITGAFVIDMGQLEYISSAGLGVLLKTHKKFLGQGQSLKLVNVNNHINDIFKYSGFDKLFDIESNQ
jgi:anti-sigma B factor antagonist